MSIKLTEEHLSQAQLDAALALAALAGAARPPPAAQAATPRIAVAAGRPVGGAAAIAVETAAAAAAAVAAAALPSFAEVLVTAGGLPLLLGLLERSSDPRLHAAAVAALASLALGAADAPAAIEAQGGVQACGCWAGCSMCRICSRQCRCLRDSLPPQHIPQVSVADAPCHPCTRVQSTFQALTWSTVASACVCRKCQLFMQLHS